MTTGTALPPPVRAVADRRNPLRELISHGRMPVMLELHLTEADKRGYLLLRRRYLADSAALPRLSLLGQYLRQLEPGQSDLLPEERGLTVKLQTYAELLGSGKVDMLALDDRARGRDSLDNAVAAELLSGLGADPARLMVNMVGRNRYPEQVRSRLAHFASLGVLNVLLLTGDLPADGGPAVFPIDSTGMCHLARQMVIEGALPEAFLVAAAGHPNPDADPDGVRTLQKALAGARLIVTQAIFDVEAFARWMETLRAIGVLDMADVIAEIIPMTSRRQLGILADVPGMRVPAELLQGFEDEEERIRLGASSGGHDEAWQAQRMQAHAARVTRTLLHRVRRVPGVRGFYLGCLKSFRPHMELLKETPLVADGPDHHRRLTKLSGMAHQRTLAELAGIQSLLGRYRARARRQATGWRAYLSRLAASERLERWLKLLESPKVLLFGCRKCDQCDLSPDGMICPRGCAKQMTHGPCGAPRKVGDRYLCEDTSRECTWAQIRERRHRLGIPLAEQLEARPAPAPGFFEGRGYSAFVPVLRGHKPPPDWVRALKSLLLPLTGRRASSSLPSLPTLTELVQSRRHDVMEWLAGKPDMHDEELLFKVLALIGTPQAVHVIESRLAGWGLPAEGTLADMSIRDLWLLAEAVPTLVERGTGEVSSDQLLAVVPRGRQLREAMRREAAGRVIRHIGSLGITVTYADSLLESHSVESFLQVLAILKDELQLQRGSLAGVGLTVRCDRVHYRHHFRAPVDVRQFLDADGGFEGRVEMVIDVKQFGTAASFRERLRTALASVPGAGAGDAEELMLESPRPESQGIVWSFNSAFWSRLREFERATGVAYDEAIGGSTDHNLAYVRSTARAFFDRVHEQGRDGGDLYVIEIGVASVTRADEFMTEFRRICDLNHADYYARTVYVLADFSDEVLESGQRALAGKHPRVECVRLDAADPAAAFERFRGRIMHAHLCNVYDNLPTDKLAWIDERPYLVEAALFIDRLALAGIVSGERWRHVDREELHRRLGALHEAPEQGVPSLLDWLRDSLVAQGESDIAYVHCWMELFQALKLRKRYVHLDGETAWRHPGAADLARRLAPVLEGRGHLQVHLNEQAISGFAALLPLLHPGGVLEVVDIFVRLIDEYGSRHKGPAKYDGSVVNWLNGPLFRAAAEPLGFDVGFHSFKPFDPRSASMIMIARRPVAHVSPDAEV